MNEEQEQLVANFKYGVIAPLVVGPLERGQQARMLREMAEREYTIPFSDRTKVGVRALERWLKLYRKGGLDALKPKPRADRNSVRSVPKEVIEKAVAMKREVPQRSVPQIITMLELAGKVEKDLLKESTLRRHLGPIEKTLGRTPKPRRRFEAPHRNHTWQSDTHQTLYLPDPEEKKKNRKVYLIATIDDYSRFVPHGQYYFDERRPRLENTLQKAMLKHGVPQRFYCDNAAIFSSPHLQRISGELGFHLIHSKVGVPQGRGKVEKFFQYVDRSFKPEAYALIAAGKLITIEQLNEYFWSWLEVAYHQRVHGSTKKTPRERFEEDETPLRVLDPMKLREAFLWQEKRRVDKTGCVNLDGNTYEVSTALIGKHVIVRYDPYDLEHLHVSYQGQHFPEAKPLDVTQPRHRNLGQAPEAPIVPTGLNLLELAKRQHEDEQCQKLGPMRFPTTTRGDDRE